MPRKKSEPALTAVSVARELEEGIGALRAFSSQVSEGRFQRTRRRLVKQLRKLDAVLAGVQRAVLTPNVSDQVVDLVRSELAALLARLQAVATSDPAKADLKDVRRATKQARLTISAQLDPGPAA